jgi:hypothetical protein
MNQVFFKLYTGHPYKTGKGIQLLLEIFNQGKSPVYLLNWLVLYNFLGESVLDLYSSGKKVLPLPNNGTGGIRVKDFRKIAPGASHIEPLDLNTLYPSLAAGTYAARLRKEKLVFMKEKPTAILLRKRFQGKNSKRKPAYKVLTSDASFTVGAVGRKNVRSRGGQPLSGTTSWNIEAALSRNAILELQTEEAPLLLRRELPEGLQPPTPCTIMGGQPQQQSMIRTAHQEGYLLAVRALSLLHPDGAYVRWFGPLSQDRFSQAQANLQAVIRDFQQQAFNYDLQGNDCQPNQFAVSQFQHRTISICKPFWSLVAAGINSQSSRVFHEHCHTSFSSTDFADSIPECEDLARTDPGDALRNAQSYEYFATV